MSLYTFLAGDVHRVRGSATVTLNSGEIHLFSVRGSYRPRDKQSRLWLIGAGLSSSSRLLIYMQSNNISSIKGTIAGQSVQVAY
jgi:hypothetical protein